MNDAKKKILARRAQFVAAAIAGLTAEGCGKTEADPRPCLAPVADTRAPIGPPAPPPPPLVCLSIAMPHDAGPPPPRPDAGTKKLDCDPPYSIDANGVKHYKPECL